MSHQSTATGSGISLESRTARGSGHPGFTEIEVRELLDSLHRFFARGIERIEYLTYPGTRWPEDYFEEGPMEEVGTGIRFTNTAGAGLTVAWDMEFTPDLDVSGLLVLPASEKVDDTALRTWPDTSGAPIVHLGMSGPLGQQMPQVLLLEFKESCRAVLTAERDGHGCLVHAPDAVAVLAAGSRAQLERDAQELLDGSELPEGYSSITWYL